ncbi:unnamed protein product, partial [marine sediment metagenome]
RKTKETGEFSEKFKGNKMVAGVGFEPTTSGL